MTKEQLLAKIRNTEQIKMLMITLSTPTESISTACVHITKHFRNACFIHGISRRGYDFIERAIERGEGEQIDVTCKFGSRRLEALYP